MESIGLQLAIVTILIFVNAFFAASEIAVISLNGNKVRREAEAGDKSARKLLKLVENPTQFLSTIQIAITLAGFLASAYAADAFTDRLVNWLIEDQGWQVSFSVLNTFSLVLITFILSYFTLILGELVPKRLAMARTEAVTRITSGVVLGASVIFRPVVRLLAASTNGVLRLLRVDPNETQEEVSEEEIRMMVDIGEEKGAIQQEEKEMIENIFEFNNITAEDVMVHRKDMVVIWMDDTPEDILQRITESGLSRFPVCGDDIDDVVGLLRTRQYLLNMNSEQPKPLAELLAPVYFVPEQVSADVLFRDMQRKKEHMAIVVDEYGGTSGLITLEDLLEEIVGNIYDEFDPQVEQEIIPLGENRWRVSGSVELDALLEIVGVPEETEEECETLGGLVFSRLAEIPSDGEKPVVECLGMRVSVEEIRERRVEWAIVEKIQMEKPTA